VYSRRCRRGFLRTRTQRSTTRIAFFDTREQQRTEIFRLRANPYDYWLFARFEFARMRVRHRSENVVHRLRLPANADAVSYRQPSKNFFAQARSRAPIQGARTIKTRESVQSDSRTDAIRMPLDGIEADRVGHFVTVV
jgi:hypothetical protein